jgi:hypothetical protein
MMQGRNLVKYINLNKYEKGKTDDIFQEVTHWFFSHFSEVPEARIFEGY